MVEATIEEKADISVHELFMGAYEYLKREYKAQEIVFSKENIPFIKSEVDGIEITYGSAIILRIGGKFWIISLGENSHSRLERLFSICFDAAKISSCNLELKDVCKILKNGIFFKNSLAVGFANGVFGFSFDSRQSLRFKQEIGMSTNLYIFKKENKGKTNIFYKPEFIPLFIEAVEKVLK